MFNSSFKALSKGWRSGNLMFLPSRSFGSSYASGAAPVSEEESMRWRKTYHLTGEGKRNACTMQTDDGHSILSDIPRAMGGGDSAPQPVYLLLAALAGCETATANFVARHMKLRVKGISFDLEAWRDQRGALGMPLPSADDPVDSIPAMLQVICGTAYVDTDASQEQVDILAHEVHKRCPVASMISASECRLEIKWVKMSPVS